MSDNRTEAQSEQAHTDTHMNSTTVTEVDAGEIQAGDRLVLEKAHRYSDSDRETHYTRLGCEVTDEIQGGFEAHALDADELELANTDRPATGNTDEFRLSLLGDEVTLFVRSTSTVFDTTTQWRHWETLDAIQRID